MKQVRELQRQLILLAKEAVGTRTAIAQRATGNNDIKTAVTFDNIRMPVAELQQSLAKAESAQQKLITIVKAYDDSIVTLFDFVKKVAEKINSRWRMIHQHLNTLLAMMNHIHELCVAIKYQFGADTSSHSMYSPALFGKMTNAVEHYVQGKGDPKAIRNYAIIDEIVILADISLGLIHQYLRSY